MAHKSPLFESHVHPMAYVPLLGPWIVVVVLKWFVSWVPVSPVKFFFGMSFTQFIIVFAYVWALLMTFFSAISMSKIRYIITDQGCTWISGGLLARREHHIAMDKITSVEVVQDCFGRMGRYGTLIIHLQGGGQTALKHVPEPREVVTLIHAQLGHVV